ncbi:MAG: sensor histidine kinase [Ardenticatenaceae bacterium]
MNDAINAQLSAHLIRRRLVWLLVKVIGSVILITVILLLVLVGLLLNRARFWDDSAPASVYVLQTYYLAHGSWEGVERLPERTLFASEDEEEEDDERVDFLLLDEQQRLYLKRSESETAQIGQVYSATGYEISYPITVNGQQVGTFVEQESLFEPSTLGPLPEVMTISCLTALLTLLIGLLLMRRIVTPLADIMAAAQQVTAGDLSARVEVSGPDDFRSLTDSFNRMVATLEKNDQERRHLLADVAHEIRTPLSIQRGRLEGILDGIYTASEAQIALVLEETLLIEKLVEDLRLLTLAEARQLPFERQPIDLGELAQRIAELFEPEADEKQISLTTQIEANLPSVMADPQRIGQVIGNLVGNALRYIPSGSRIEISVQPLKEKGKNQAVALSVSDNGPGIKESDLPHLFDRFWRGEKSRARSSGGAGLGLAIAKQLIEAQGGRIHAQNQAQGGLRVTFVLL